MNVRGVTVEDDGDEQALEWMSVLEGMNPVDYTEPLVFFRSCGGHGGRTNKTMTSVISFISKKSFFFSPLSPECQIKGSKSI